MSQENPFPASQQTPRALEVSLASLVELAVEWWRLERWLNSSAPQGNSLSHARHAARRLGKFLEERELSVLDITGQHYEPGLAVEVLDVVEDASASVDASSFIEEMVAPVVLWRGAVVKYGQAIVRRRK